MWSPLWFILVCKKPQFRTAHHISLERRHPEVTKDSYYVMSSEGSQKRRQLMHYLVRTENFPKITCSLIRTNTLQNTLPPRFTKHLTFAPNSTRFANFCKQLATNVNVREDICEGDSVERKSSLQRSKSAKVE